MARARTKTFIGMMPVWLSFPETEDYQVIDMKCRMRSRIHHHLLFLPLLVLLLGWSGFSIAQAQAESRLDVTSSDTSGFPMVSLNVIAAAGDSSRLPDLNGLILNEAGQPVTDYQVTQTDVGTELIFIIDANASIGQRDEAGGLTRHEKVRDSIIRYANQFMDKGQLDRVSIIVPSEDGAVLLLDQAVFPNAVINEVNFYEAVPVDPTPLNEMVSLALDKATESRAEGRFQAVVLFTDGAELDEQLDYPTLVNKAQAINIPIFSAILGARADEDEIANVNGLAQPTRGSYVHMPETTGTDPIYNLIQSHGSQFQVQYRSQLASSGLHDLALELAGASAETQVEVEIAPPATEIVVDNSRPIRRVVASPDDPLTSAEPANQPIVARVTWPDGHTRMLADATLLVDGTPQPPVSNPELSADGLIILDWDIRNLDAGTYELFVKVNDELGLQGQSNVLPMAIVVEGLAEGVTETVATAPAGEVEEGASEATQGLLQNLSLAGLAIGLLALLGAVIIIILVIVLIRRRRRDETPPAAPAAPVTQSASPAEHEATQVIMPAFAAQSSTSAYFEPLENAPDHGNNIALPSSNVAIGRDPNLAQVVFADKSVSRLHARVMEQNGVFQLYDEGSASGTYINFKQITLKPQVLNDNDDVHFGRVHLRFHVVPVVEDADSTQVMPSPMRPEEAGPVAAEEGLSTQPYMPNQPGSAGRPQAPPPRRDEPSPQSDEDEDDISTQPYMPHSPRR